MRRFEVLLDRAGDVDLPLRARATLDYGGCADWSGDYDRARPAYERSGELFREAGDESGVAESVFRLGVIASRTGDFELARRLWEESLDTWQRLGDTIGEAIEKIVERLARLVYPTVAPRNPYWQAVEDSVTIERS